MRRDLDVWPGEAGSRSAEAGVTRRGFLAGAGLASAVLVAGGIAWRGAERQGPAR
jgi:hypothetical protein